MFIGQILLLKNILRLDIHAEMLQMLWMYF